ARRAARTGNTAGEVAGMDLLAQNKAKTMSGVAAGDQIQFANRAKSDVSQGLKGASELYGMDTNLLARSLGLPPEYLQQYNNGANQKSQGGLSWSWNNGLGINAPL
ncbi:MAG TPA: hypothetical protein VKQ28_05250, partial [Candidatus Acidoferrum sp.]|nr:hypothetical protein [Candidatus Acidoferrum sp.]